jgi:hypothetical protein
MSVEPKICSLKIQLNQGASWRVGKGKKGKVLVKDEEKE